MIMGAYCVGKVQNMLPRLHYDNCAYCVGRVTQYATLKV